MIYLVLLGFAIFSFALFLMHVSEKKAYLHHDEKRVFIDSVPEPSPDETKTPYMLKNRVLTQNELGLFYDLKQIAGDCEMTLLSKVRLADFIFLPKQTKNYITWLNKITAKHIDFLLCDKAMRPLLAIELDDGSHERAERIERDKFVDKVYDNIGLDVIHVQNYDAVDLKNRILDALNSEFMNAAV